MTDSVVRKKVTPVKPDQFSSPKNLYMQIMRLSSMSGNSTRALTQGLR